MPSVLVMRPSRYRKTNIPPTLHKYQALWSTSKNYLFVNPWLFSNTVIVQYLTIIGFGIQYIDQSFQRNPNTNIFYPISFNLDGKGKGPRGLLIRCQGTFVLKEAFPWTNANHEKRWRNVSHWPRYLWDFLRRTHKRHKYTEIGDPFRFFLWIFFTSYNF